MALAVDKKAARHHRSVLVEHCSHQVYLRIGQQLHQVAHFLVVTMIFVRHDHGGAGAAGNHLGVGILGTGRGIDQDHVVIGAQFAQQAAKCR